MHPNLSQIDRLFRISLTSADGFSSEYSSEPLPYQQEDGAEVVSVKRPLQQKMQALEPARRAEAGQSEELQRAGGEKPAVREGRAPLRQRVEMHHEALHDRHVPGEALVEFLVLRDDAPVGSSPDISSDTRCCLACTSLFKGHQGTPVRAQGLLHTSRYSFLFSFAFA